MPKYFKGRFYLGLVLLAASFSAIGSSIEQVDFTQLNNGAELIFEGRIIGIRTDTEGSTRSVHTWVKFEILDLIKGHYDQPTIELSFLGGTADGRTVHVSDMQIPTMGEHGVYFVENVNRRMVNPLYGWAQGHFLVKYDRALKRQVVTTLNGKPVYGIDINVRQSTTRALSQGVAKGVVVDSDARQTHAPMDVADFKVYIRGVVE